MIRCTTLLFCCLFIKVTAPGQGFLKASGTTIINDTGEVMLRGMGLGGWMLQEPYMLQLSGAATNQQDINKKIIDLVGYKRTAAFSTLR